MIKKIGAIIFAIFIVIINFITCFIPKEKPIEITATARGRTDNLGIIIIDDEIIALSADPTFINQACILILEAINIKRTEAGLGALAQSSDLMVAAYIRAREQEQKFSHTRPDGSEFWTCNSVNCYGECLSKGYNENEVVTAWMNSPTHKAVMMDNEYKIAGVGMHNANGICYIALETGY